MDTTIRKQTQTTQIRHDNWRQRRTEYRPYAESEWTPQHGTQNGHHNTEPRTDTTTLIHIIGQIKKR
jgi:hypothetical protein